MTSKQNDNKRLSGETSAKPIVKDEHESHPGIVNILSDIATKSFKAGWSKNVNKDDGPRKSKKSIRLTIHPVDPHEAEKLLLSKHEEEEREKRRLRRRKNWWKRCCAYYPCCLGIPLDIGLQIISGIDLVYSIICFILWIILLGSEFFAVHHLFNPQLGKVAFNRPTEKPATQVTTPSNTQPPSWTVIPTTTLPPIFGIADMDERDQDADSKIYSKISVMTNNSHLHVSKHCGHSYLINYLTYHNLNRTDAIWSEFLHMSISCEVLNIVFAISILVVSCCLIEHGKFKMTLIVLWYLQMIPVFMTFQSVILSQSKRLCILEYGWYEQGVRYQSAIFYFQVFRIVIFKPYQSMLTFFYIKELLRVGYIVDENEELQKEQLERMQYVRNPVGRPPPAILTAKRELEMKQQRANKIQRYKQYPEEQRDDFKEDLVTDIIAKLQNNESFKPTRIDHDSDSDEDQSTGVRKLTSAEKMKVMFK